MHGCYQSHTLQARKLRIEAVNVAQEKDNEKKDKVHHAACKKKDDARHAANIEKDKALCACAADCKDKDHVLCAAQEDNDKKLYAARKEMETKKPNFE